MNQQKALFEKEFFISESVPFKDLSHYNILNNLQYAKIELHIL